MLRMLIKALFTQTIPEVQKPYLERMGLWHVKGVEERIFRNLLANELKYFVKN